MRRTVFAWSGGRERNFSGERSAIDIDEVTDILGLDALLCVLALQGRGRARVVGRVLGHRAGNVVQGSDRPRSSTLCSGDEYSFPAEGTESVSVEKTSSVTETGSRSDQILGLDLRLFFIALDDYGRHGQAVRLRDRRLRMSKAGRPRGREQGEARSAANRAAVTAATATATADWSGVAALSSRCWQRAEQVRAGGKNASRAT